MDTTQAIKIRRFESGDLESVMEINKTCLPENYTSTFFLDIQAKHPEGFLVALNDDRIVGYIMCRLERGFSETSRFHFARKGHVVSVAVLPEHRRRGIASELVNKATHSFAEKNAEECFLEVRMSNRPAIELYKKLGFQETRQIPFYYQNGESALVMSKTLR